MVIKMLQAVSAMLKFEGADDTKGFFARVECSKIMLDKVIEGMVDEEKSKYAMLLLPSTDVPIPEQHKPEKPKVEKTPSGQYRVVVNEMKQIVKIENLPLDGKVELDGKVMTHQEAIGKTFGNARIL